MIIGIILGSAALVAIVAGILFWRGRGRRKSAMWYVAAAVIGLAVGLAFAVFGWNTIRQDLHYRHWPSVTGTIVSGRVIGERAFHPEITYRYQVGDSTYTGVSSLDTPGFGGKRKRYDVAETEVAEHPPGETFTIHYNPDNPADSRLRTGPSYSSYLHLSVGVVLFMAGLFFLTGPVARRE